MNVISSRQVLFENEKYKAEVDGDGKETGKRVKYIENSEHVIVRASTEVQVVPDWVKDTDLFNMMLEDGTILEVSSTYRQPQLKQVGAAGPVGIDKSNQPPVAQLAKDVATDGNENKQNVAPPPVNTGWGQTGQ